MIEFKPAPSSGLQWPDSFINNDISGLNDELLCADALVAWGISMITRRPETFGETMAKIAEKLNVSGTPESFLEWTEKEALL